jgi:hypothetical protein
VLDALAPLTVATQSIDSREYTVRFCLLTVDELLLLFDADKRIFFRALFHSTDAAAAVSLNTHKHRYTAAFINHRIEFPNAAMQQAMAQMGMGAGAGGGQMDPMYMMHGELQQNNV